MLAQIDSKEDCQFQTIKNKSNNNSKTQQQQKYNNNHEEKCGETEETGCMENENKSREIKINNLASSAQICALPLH